VPDSVCTTVRTGSSHIGSTRASIPRRCASSSVIAVGVRSARSASARSSCSASARSPSGTSPGPRRRISIAWQAKVSPAGSQPLAASAMPASA
jgi:hypothetical protein